MLKVLTRKLFLVVFLLGVFAIPGLTQAADQLSDLTINGRQYLQFVPEQCQTAPCSLLFSFHGHYGTRQGAMGYAGLQDAARANNMIVVAPESLTPPPKNITNNGTVLFSNYDNTGKRWDVAHVQSAERCTSSDLTFVDQLIDTVKSQYEIPEGHVFTTGVSFGAVMSYYVAACLPEVEVFAETAGGLAIYPKDTVLVTSLLNSITDPFLKLATQFVLNAWANEINGLGANQYPSNNVAWSFYPVPVPQVTSTKNLQGFLAHDPRDTVVRSLWSDNLASELGRMSQTAKKIVTNVGHAWDVNLVQPQMNWFKAKSPLLVSWEADRTSCTEGEQIVVNLNLNRPNQADLVVNLSSLSDGLAFDRQSVLFAASPITDAQIMSQAQLSAVSQSFVVTCVDDQVLEPEQVLDFALAVATTEEMVLLSEPQLAVTVAASDQVYAPFVEAVELVGEEAQLVVGTDVVNQMRVLVKTQSPAQVSKLELAFNRSNRLTKAGFYAQFNADGTLRRCLVNLSSVIRDLGCTANYQASEELLTMDFSFKANEYFGASANNKVESRLTFKNPLAGLAVQNSGFVIADGVFVSVFGREIVDSALLGARVISPVVNRNGLETIDLAFDFALEKANLLYYVDLILNYKNGSSTGRVKADIGLNGTVTNCRILTGNGADKLASTTCEYVFDETAKVATLIVRAVPSSLYPLKTNNNFSYKTGYYNLENAGALVTTANYVLGSGIFETR